MAERLKLIPVPFDKQMWNERAEKLNALMEELDLEPTVRIDYSGRAMFGTRCVGLDLGPDDPSVETVIHACGKVGLPVPKTDAMGLGSIVYWDRWSVKEEWVEELQELFEEEWTFLIE